MRNLISWAEGKREPLASYAVGLLGAAMDVQEVAGNFKEHNTRLVPKMLNRLRELQLETEELNRKEASDVTRRPFANLDDTSSVTFAQPHAQRASSETVTVPAASPASKRPRESTSLSTAAGTCDDTSSPPAKASKLSDSTTPARPEGANLSFAVPHNIPGSINVHVLLCFQEHQSMLKRARRGLSRSRT